MTQLEQQVMESLRTLPFEKQQEVLDFVEFLKARFDSSPVRGNESLLNGQSSEKPKSLLEAAGNLIGCVDGPEDLSTNKKYMEGFGKS